MFYNEKNEISYIYHIIYCLYYPKPMTPCADAMIVADYRATDIILREHNAYLLFGKQITHNYYRSQNV